MKLATYTKTGAKSQTAVTANKQLFGAEVKPELIAQAVRVYLSNQRQGSSKAQTRGEVTRTKKKWYKQKGTGNARHGARSANIFVGGGAAHGPTGLENWKKAMTQRQKSQALIGALTAQVENVLVWDGVNELAGKTKEAVQLLNKLVDEKDKVLVVVAEPKTETLRALRNLENVMVTKASRLNVYEVALANKIIFTNDALEQLAARLKNYLKK